MRRFEKQWRAKAKDVNFSFSLIIADLLRLMQSHVTSSLLTLAIICTSVHRIFPCVQILRHDTKGGVNIMHHLGQVHVNNRVSASDPKSQPLRLKFMKHMPFGAQHQLK